MDKCPLTVEMTALMAVEVTDLMAVKVTDLMVVEVTALISLYQLYTDCCLLGKRSLN